MSKFPAYKILHIIWWLFICSSTLSSAQEFATGKVIDSIQCVNQPGQFYSIYLPSQYSPAKKWPIVYIFEPASRAHLATELFSQAGESLGIIIVCSQNSRNGSWDIVFDAANAMFEDTHQRFSLDQNRVYTAGFSGGSRAAVTIAILTDRIRGVVGCGAGFSPNSNHAPQPSDDFDYIGIVGNADMNYQEHFTVKARLDNLGLENRLIHFEGPHQWPSPEVIEEALTWLRLLEMKDGVIEPDKEFINNQFTKGKQKADSLLNRHQLVEALTFYKQMATDYSDWLSTKEISNTIDNIEQDKNYSRALKSMQKIRKKESDLRDKFLQAFTEMAITQFKASGESVKDKTWWNSQIKNLKRMESEESQAEKLMAARILNMIWANCAESIWNYVNQGQQEVAFLLSDIWLLVQPNQVWPWVNRARLLANYGHKEEAFDALIRASNFGLKSVDFMENDQFLKYLLKDSRFKDLKLRVNTNNLSQNK